MRVREGESFVVTVPATSPAAPRPQVMPLAIAHEDEHLIVIDKPAGLVVHAGAGNPDGTLVNALIAHCPEGLRASRAPAGDRTSPRQGYQRSARCRQDRCRAPRSRVSSPSTPSNEPRFVSVWEIHLGRAYNNHDRTKSPRSHTHGCGKPGKAAVTDYKTIRIIGSFASLVECRLRTGRTHQIRVHMALTATRLSVMRFTEDDARCHHVRDGGRSRLPGYQRRHFTHF